MVFELPPLAVTHPQDIAPEDLDLTPSRAVEADNRAQQDRFPGAGTADDAENFAAKDVEVESVMDGFGAEPVDEPMDADNTVGRMSRHGQIWTMEKKIENAASVTITRKIASTTDNVVRRPTLSALRAT